MQWSVTGHEAQKAVLERTLAAGAVPHALLFAGPDGVGKRTMAEDLLAALVPPQARLLDTMRLSPEPDDEGGLADVTVAQVRAMRGWAALTPTGKHKVVLMDAVERLNDECANTLLKLLEEPPDYAHFLLVTSAPAAVLPTVASRCQRLDFAPLSDAELTAALAGRKLSEDDRKLLAVLAGGRPGAALTLLARGELRHAARAIADLQEALSGGDAARIALAGRVAEAGNAAQVTGWWLAYAHARLAEKPQLTRLMHALLDTHAAVSDSSFNAKLALEHGLLTATE